MGPKAINPQDVMTWILFLMAVVIENGRYTGCHLNNSTDPRPIPAECS